MFQSFSVLLLIVSLFSVINNKFIKIPNTIGLMILGIILVLGMSLIKLLSEETYDTLCKLIEEADFKDLLFDGLLSFLLFAGAIHVNYKLLIKQRRFVLPFVSVSVLISTFLVGTFCYYISLLLQMPIDYVVCLLFGALISPTDPIAALAILSKSGVSNKIKIKIEGEALFNDGMGVIVFSGILIFFNATENSDTSFITMEIFELFFKEVVGGVIYGLSLGYLGYRLIKWCTGDDDLQVILSLAIAVSGYAIANSINVSGPLAMVVAGITVGNNLNLNNEDKNKHLRFFNKFWGTLDETLNGILFLLMGLSLHIITFSLNYILLSIILVVLVLLSRYISVLIPYSIFKHGEKDKGVLRLLTWGGLRGGISLGLAISLPEIESKDIIVFLTFMVVAFSIIVQGLTIGGVSKKISKK